MNTSRSLISLALIGFSFSAYGGDSYGVLPNSYTPQLRIDGSTTVASYGHYNLDEIKDYRTQYLVNATRSDRVYANANSLDPVILSNSASTSGTMGIGWMHATSGASATTEPPLGVLAKHTRATADSRMSMAMSDTLIIHSATQKDGQQGIIHATVAVKTANAGGTYGPSIGTAARESYRGQANLDIESYDWVKGPPEAPLVHSRTSNVLRYESLLSGATGYPEYSAVSYQATSLLDPSGVHMHDQQNQISGWVSIDFDIPFTFGKAFGIDMYGAADFKAGTDIPALSANDPAYAFPRRADGALTFDMRWQGIDSIDAIGTGLTTLSGGGSSRAVASLGVNDYSIEAQSGADYVHAMAPVPEPETWAMLFAGFGVIGFVRRSRRRDRGVGQS